MPGGPTKPDGWEYRGESEERAALGKPIKSGMPENSPKSHWLTYACSCLPTYTPAESQEVDICSGSPYRLWYGFRLGSGVENTIQGYWLGRDGLLDEAEE